MDALSVQLSVTAQVTPTPLWAVVWGPTQPLEDETNHFLSSQETELLHRHGNQQGATAPGDGLYRDTSMQPREEEGTLDTKEEGEDEGRTEEEETGSEEGGNREIRMNACMHPVLQGMKSSGAALTLPCIRAGGEDASPRGWWHHPGRNRLLSNRETRGKT